MKTKKVWTLYAADVERFILSKVSDKVIAEDLLQETFIKVHTKLDTLKSPEKLKSWLFSIARNVVMDYFRKPDVDQACPEHDLASEDPKPDHTKEDCLHGIIKSLPKKYRDSLILSDIQGLKQQQIADQLDLPLPTVKSHIQRGRKLIAQGFVDCCDFKLNEEGFLVGELQDKEDCKVCN